MADTKLSWRELVQGGPEMKMDYRLMEKRVEEGFMSREEFDAFMKKLPEETEYDFTQAEVLDEQDEHAI